MKKKGLITSISCIVFPLLLVAIPQKSILAVSSPKLPKVITMTTLPVGTSKYAQAAAFRAAVETFTPMKLRLENACHNLLGPMNGV
jgi:hypothetical protein